MHVTACVPITPLLLLSISCYALVNFRPSHLRRRLPSLPLLLGEVKCIVGHLAVTRPHVECPIRSIWPSVEMERYWSREPCEDTRNGSAAAPSEGEWRQF